MGAIKTITFSLPAKMGKEIEKAAKEENRTISELIRETFRRYQAQRNFKSLATKDRKIVKRKGLTEKDFGGPFAK